MLAWIDVKETDTNAIDVSLYITPLHQMELLGMDFSVNYSYNYGRYEYPCSLNAEHTQVHTDFSGAQIVTNTTQSGRYDYYWDSSSPVTVTADKTILLARMSFDVSDDVHEGEYDFALTCNDCYRAVIWEEGDSLDVASVMVDTTLGSCTFWYGQRLEATSSEITLEFAVIVGYVGYMIWKRKNRIEK